jgi:hypothetical protein
MHCITPANNKGFQLALTRFKRFKESKTPHKYSPTFLADKVYQIMYDYYWLGWK